jgi:hypothetical protein
MENPNPFIYIFDQLLDFSFSFLNYILAPNDGFRSATCNLLVELLVIWTTNVREFLWSPPT